MGICLNILVPLILLLPLVSSAQTALEWTTTPVETVLLKGEERVNEIGILQDVRIGKHKGFDRIVFAFRGDLVPPARIKYVRPPFYLGESDERVKISGKHFIEMFFNSPAYAHDIESGKETVPERISVKGIITIKEVRRIYDHEGQFTYVLGLNNAKKYRVQTLLRPSRLVVDVMH